MSDATRTTPPNESVIYDRLEHELKLSNLINPESLGNLIERFASFHDVSFTAVDIDGTRLAGANGAVPPTAVATPATTSSQAEDKFRAVHDDQGRCFLSARVDNQFDAIGYLVLGPFRRDGERRLSDQRARELAGLLCTVLEEVVFANYQSYLFSKMHLQLSKENIGEVTGGDDEPTYEQTMLDSGEFRSLF